MARFHFDVISGQRLTSDDQGQDCRDLEQAEREAVAIALELARDRMLESDVPTLTVVVRDALSRSRLSVRVSVQIDR